MSLGNSNNINDINGHNEELCRAQTLQNAKLLEGFTSDETKSAKLQVIGGFYI